MSTTNDRMTTYQKATLALQGTIAAIGIIAGIMVSDALSEMKEISNNAARVVEGVERLANMDPAKFLAAGKSVADATDLVGNGAAGAAVIVGDGASKAILAVRNAASGDLSVEPDSGADAEDAEKTSLFGKMRDAMN